MARPLISAKYPPLIDATRCPLAYGDRALPRLNRELNDPVLLVRQRAVMSLCDYLHDPEHIATALRTGIAQSLKKLLTDPDITVRQKSTECLYVFASHAIGRNAFLEFEIIGSVANLFDDPEDIARKNAHMAIEMISNTIPGAVGVVEEGLVPILVEKVKTEHDEIKVLILDTLHFCMQVNTEQALKSGAMKVFTDLLEHKWPSIRAKAARDIMNLSVPLQGKNEAVELDTMRLLVALLTDDSPTCRCSAAGAIASIAITTKGKYTALGCEAIDPLVNLVSDDVSEVRVNVLKALTCISEAPEARKILLEHVHKVKELTEDPIPNVVKAAEIAVKVITWKP